jgi:hypothetical protein
MLHAAHERSAVASLHVPTEGVFPRALQVRPRPLVLDTQWLASDVHYACVKGRRTTLVTAANQQAVRVFCSQHVIDEVQRHHDLWSVNHDRRPIPADGMRERKGVQRATAKNRGVRRTALANWAGVVGRPRKVRLTSRPTACDTPVDTLCHGIRP